MSTFHVSSDIGKVVSSYDRKSLLTVTFVHRSV